MLYGLKLACKGTSILSSRQKTDVYICVYIWHFCNEISYFTCKKHQKNLNSNRNAIRQQSQPTRLTASWLYVSEHSLRSVSDHFKITQRWAGGIGLGIPSASGFWLCTGLKPGRCEDSTRLYSSVFISSLSP